MLPVPSQQKTTLDLLILFVLLCNVVKFVVFCAASGLKTTNISTPIHGPVGGQSGFESQEGQSNWLSY